MIVSDRKYRHSGYQDGGGYDKKSPRPPRTPYEPQRQRLEGAPRGRTAGGFGPDAFKCNKCGELRHQGLTEVTTDTVCLKCSADLHTCGNCRFFDTTATWECKANITVRVASKHARNECSLFAPKIVRDLVADKRKPEKPDDARKAFEALFKK